MLSVLDTQQLLWPPHSTVDGVFGGVPHFLQNGAFSFPMATGLLMVAGKEIIARGLLRLRWSQLMWEDEELTSHWALPLLVPSFRGAGQGRAD